jgi:hypothetical protein
MVLMICRQYQRRAPPLSDVETAMVNSSKRSPEIASHWLGGLKTQAANPGGCTVDV